MEGGTLFNPGFLGGSFNWWIGQIASDSTWRDNGLAGKFESKDQIPGWGKRCKVRIIGLHDREETTISSDQLPWAQVMYPVTGGGGQAQAGATANLRQGNFVFGFFLDGQDQQVPVIMGVLGSNAQTALGGEIGTDKANFSSTSGHATPADGNKDPYIKVPQEGLVVTNPSSTSTSATQGAAASGATKENVDAVHEMSAADVARNDYYNKKMILMSPCDVVGSALKAIQTELENLTAEIDKYLNAAQSYIDAVSSYITDIQSIISNAACEIAKYMKIVFDKIFEFSLKQINAALAPTVGLMFPNQRYLYIDIKDIITELLTCLYNGITNDLCGQVQALLDEALSTDPESLPEPTNENTIITPTVPSCSTEQLVGDLIALNMDQIESTTTDILDSVSSFLDDVLGGISDISGVISDASSLIGDITGSITGALSFENISLNILGCELTPSCPSADYYTIANGGASAPAQDAPTTSNVDKAAQTSTTTATTPTTTPYAVPTSSTSNLQVGQSNAETQAAAVEENAFTLL